MTCILYDGRGHIYADSMFVKGKDLFASLSKIMPCLEPVAIEATTGSGSDFDGTPQFTDTIYGYVSSGNQQTANAYVQMLIDIQVSSLTNHAYITSFRNQLANDENLFELILLGKEANYYVLWSPSEFRVDTLPLTKVWAMGSGGPLAREEYKAGSTALRSMFLAFLQDPLSGGMIDVWYVDREGNRMFRKGMVRAKNRDQLLAEVADMKAPYTLDFVDYAIAEANGVMKERARNEEERAAQAARPAVQGSRSGRRRKGAEDEGRGPEPAGRGASGDQSGPGNRRGQAGRLRPGNDPARADGKPAGRAGRQRSGSADQEPGGQGQGRGQAGSRRRQTRG